MDYSSSYSSPMNESTASQMSPVMLGLIILLSVAFYIYYAYCLYNLAKKTNTPYEWLAWIPVIGEIYTFKIARVSVWWALLLVIPFANIIIYVYVWMKIVEERRRNKWLGLLMIISPVNLILIWILAFKEASNKTETAPPAQVV